jgi:hypothetical protein
MAILCKVVWPAEDVFRGALLTLLPLIRLVCRVCLLCAELGTYDALADKAEAGVLCHGWRSPSSSASSPILAAPRRPAPPRTLSTSQVGSTRNNAALFLRSSQSCACRPRSTSNLRLVPSCSLGARRSLTPVPQLEDIQ